MSERATLIGASALLIWACMAVLSTQLKSLPPLELTAIALGIGTLLPLIKWFIRKENPVTRLRQPLAVWAVGIWGIFGFHFFYFWAFRLAPAVEANLINYLWPLLVVLFSGLLPGERIRWWHLLGTGLGLGGLVVLLGGRLGFQGQYLAGYAAALGSALSWSSYSVLSRRFGSVPTDVVGGFCAVSGLLALICHLLVETTVMPDPRQWLILLGVGLGPVGIAFYAWDFGMKKGDIRALGAMSYGAPLISTFLLVAFGQANATTNVWLACALIVCGAMLGGLDLWRRPATQG